MFFELKLVVVRIKEYGYNISRIQVSFAVVFNKLLLSNIQVSHKVSRSRLVAASLVLREI
jgi:hypothetical protein